MSPLSKKSHTAAHAGTIFLTAIAVTLNAADSLFTNILRYKKSFYGIFQKYTV
jgi:hypothetical protein